MAAVISAPKSWVASVGRLALPKNADKRLQTLMDANNEGRLSAAERRELAALVERFESRSADIVVGAGGRLIKTLGDEILFVAFNTFLCHCHTSGLRPGESAMGAAGV